MEKLSPRVTVCDVIISSIKVKSFFPLLKIHSTSLIKESSNNELSELYSCKLALACCENFSSVEIKATCFVGKIQMESNEEADEIKKWNSLSCPRN